VGFNVHWRPWEALRSGRESRAAKKTPHHNIRHNAVGRRAGDHGRRHRRRSRSGRHHGRRPAQHATAATPLPDGGPTP